jgi:hypothetical protein
MSSSSWLFTHDTQVRHSAGDLIKTHAERLAVEQLERAEQRRQALAEQRSESNTPQMRIRTWEKLHGLRLPSDPHHIVLPVIARSTGLTLSEVLEEQRVRTSSAPVGSIATVGHDTHG